MIMMNRETAVIRECFPTSVLLGSIERPVEPQVVVVVVAVAIVVVVVVVVVKPSREARGPEGPVR